MYTERMPQPLYGADHRGSKRRRIKLVATLGAEALFGLVLLSHSGCTTTDPGPNFVVPDQTFDADYFFCHVEPEILVTKKCGDATSSCHFNSSAVTGMALENHPVIDCGGGDHPIDSTQIGSGSPAQGNLEAVSLEMSNDYLTAPLYVRPTGTNHQTIYSPSDSIVEIIKTWSLK